MSIPSWRCARSERDEKDICYALRILAKEPALTALIAENKPISFAVLKDGEVPPMFFFRRVLKLNPALLQLFVGLLQIVASVGHVHKRANPVLVVIGGEQNNARFRFGNAQFDPALLFVERLVGDDGKS